MSHALTMPCPKCGRTGEVPLTPVLRKVYELLRARELSAPELHRIAFGYATRPTASNQRLEKLRALGYAKRRRVAGVWRYSLRFFSR